MLPALLPSLVLASRSLYEREGFFVLRDLLTPADVFAMRKAVLQHLASPAGRLHRNSMGGKTSGGYYIADFPRFVRLRGVLPLLESKPKLLEAMRDVLGGPAKVLSRNESTYRS